jgi:ParB family chromosome partitioning protein
VIRFSGIDKGWWIDLGWNALPKEGIAMTRRLGRGLGSLLGDPEGTDREEGSEGRDRFDVAVTQIRPNPFQPRKVFDPEGLEELRASIQRHGILQPIVLRQVEGGYELISGERRWRAAQGVGLAKVPAVVRTSVSDADMLELALVENVQRRDLDPMERALGYRALMDKLSLTQQGVADRVGQKRATVANHLRLLELPEQVQEALQKGLISMGHARALLGLSSSKAMTQMVGQIVRQDLSVREVERLVRNRQAAAADPAGVDTAPPQPEQAPWARDLERRIQERLGTKVALQDQGNGRGRIVIDYFNRADLDRVLGVLAPREEF